MAKKLVFILAALALAGCKEEIKAPEISDINNIVIEGEKYTAKRYMEKFCVFPNAEKDKNCVIASAKANKDMSKPVKVDW